MSALAPFVTPDQFRALQKQVEDLKKQLATVNDTIPPDYGIANKTQRGLLGPADYAKLNLVTTTTPGILTASDKVKLDGLARPVIRLNFTQASDLFAGGTLTAGAWTNVGAAQTFAMTSAATTYLLVVRLAAPINYTPASFYVGTRVLIDGIGIMLSAGVGGPGWEPAVGGVLVGNALAAGNHTVQVQVTSNQAGALWLRPATAANYELFGVQVAEVMP